jgi:hypothetical protein
LTNFVSVSTAAARYQDISLNPQKLAGQCAKLKCCLNFEVDTYVEASKKLPPKEAKLETADNLYYYFKADIFKREVTYSTDKSIPANLVTISARRAFEVIALNKNGEKPLTLQADEKEEKKKSSEYADILDQDSLTRFDKKKKKKKQGGNANNGNQKSQPKNPNQKAQQPQTQQPQAQQPKGQKSQSPQKAQKPQPSQKPQSPQKPQAAQKSQPSQKPQQPKQKKPSQKPEQNRKPAPKPEGNNNPENNKPS